MWGAMNESETIWSDTTVMWFDWTEGGELIDSERLGVDSQQVCVAEEVLPAILYAIAFHSFSALTLFDCE